MENLDKLENFLPRPIPNREKRPLMVNPAKGRKMTFILLFVTVFFSVVAWWIGSRGDSFVTQPPKISVSPTNIMTPTQTPANVSKEINDTFTAITKGLKGRYGFYVYNLTTKLSAGVSDQESFPSASLMKLPVILTLYQEAEAGKINLDTEYILKSNDKITGAGSLQYKPVGTKYTYRKLAELMGKQSDNTAFHVLQTILGDRRVQKTIDDLGMKNTSLKDFLTSPYDIGLLFRKFYSGSLLTREHRDEIVTFLTDTFDETRIPAGVPDGIRVAHKVGTDIGLMSDGGIVFGPKPYIVVILTDSILESEARVIVPRISTEIWNYEALN